MRDDPSHADSRSVVLIPGVASGSRLGRHLATALTGHVRPCFEVAGPPSGGSWRRIVAGTALQWWGDCAPKPVTGAKPLVIVDLHGTARPPGRIGRTWEIVDAAGTALLSPMHALHAVHRAPFTASLFLVERDGAAAAGRLLAEAHLSSAVPYRRLLDALGRAASGLLRRGLEARQPDRAWAPVPAAPNRRLLLSRSRLASAAHWLRARLGGDLYGIAVLDRSPATCLQHAVLSPLRWQKLAASEGFIADPFFWPGVPDVVLCEAYSHRTGCGRLASYTVGSPGPPKLRTRLATDHHLSYPFAWREGGRILCLPEMASTRRQMLYELKDDQAMAPVCVIAEDVAMADPTIMHKNDLYWLMYTDADLGPFDNLCLMFAGRPEGPWHRHPGNPVKVDVRSSRPGGTPFRVADRWFRPAQDCSRTYGGALAINEIVACTTERYLEEVVAVLRPDPAGEYPDGIHTLAVGDGRLLIDGKRISFHPAILLHKLKRYAAYYRCSL